MPQGTVAQQSETLVGCNSLVAVAAQSYKTTSELEVAQGVGRDSLSWKVPSGSLLPATVAKSQMNRSYVGTHADSREDFRGRFQEPGRKRFRWYSKDLTNDCR
jgi:hypothetical protein